MIDLLELEKNIEKISTEYKNSAALNKYAQITVMTRIKNASSKRSTVCTKSVTEMHGSFVVGFVAAVEQYLRKWPNELWKRTVTLLE